VLDEEEEAAAAAAAEVVEKEAQALALAQRGFSTEQIGEFEAAFETYDIDHSGTISTVELGQCMASFGERRTAAELREMIAEVDTDGSGQIDFIEFLGMMRLKLADAKDDQSMQRWKAKLVHLTAPAARMQSSSVRMALPLLERVQDEQREKTLEALVGASWLLCGWGLRGSHTTAQMLKVQQMRRDLQKFSAGRRQSQTDGMHDVSKMVSELDWTVLRVLVEFLADKQRWRYPRAKLFAIRAIWSLCGPAAEHHSEDDYAEYSQGVGMSGAGKSKIRKPEVGACRRLSAGEERDAERNERVKLAGMTEEQLSEYMQKKAAERTMKRKRFERHGVATTAAEQAAREVAVGDLNVMKVLRAIVHEHTAWGGLRLEAAKLMQVLLDDELLPPPGTDLKKNVRGADAQGREVSQRCAKAIVWARTAPMLDSHECSMLLLLGSDELSCQAWASRVLARLLTDGEYGGAVGDARLHDRAHLISIGYNEGIGAKSAAATAAETDYGIADPVGVMTRARRNVASLGGTQVLIRRATSCKQTLDAVTEGLLRIERSRAARVEVAADAAEDAKRLAEVEVEEAAARAARGMAPKKKDAKKGDNEDEKGAAAQQQQGDTRRAEDELIREEDVAEDELDAEAAVVTDTLRTCLCCLLALSAPGSNVPGGGEGSSGAPSAVVEICKTAYMLLMALSQSDEEPDDGSDGTDVEAGTEAQQDEMAAGALSVLATRILHNCSLHPQNRSLMYKLQLELRLHDLQDADATSFAAQGSMRGQASMMGGAGANIIDGSVYLMPSTASTGMGMGGGMGMDMGMGMGMGGGMGTGMGMAGGTGTGMGMAGGMGPGAGGVSSHRRGTGASAISVRSMRSAHTPEEEEEELEEGGVGGEGADGAQEQQEEGARAAGGGGCRRGGRMRTGGGVNSVEQGWARGEITHGYRQG
jgi:calmodulin